MSKNLKRMLAAGCCALVLCLSGLRLLLPLCASGYDGRCGDYAAEILNAVSGGDPGGWAQNTLPAEVGRSASDWYTMALSAHYGYDMSAYGAALQQYLAANDEPSPVSRERLALTLTACTPEPPAVCTEILDSSAEGLGIMSRIFALHLLNNGVPSGTYSRSDLVTALVSLQAPDGGWSLTGEFGDPDVTAMTLQALAPYRDDSAAADAVARGVDYLSAQQLPSGAYQSFGTENPESTAQVWIALCALGTDPLADSRFIRDGHSLLDGLLQFRVSEGAYSHTAGGGANQIAAMQVFLALTAAEMQHNGEGALLQFRDFASEPQQPAVNPETPQQTAAPAQKQPAETTQTVSGTASAVTQTTAATVSGHTTTAVSGTASESAAASAVTQTTALQETVPEVILTTAPPADLRSDAEKYPYRLPLIIAAIAIFGAAAVICLLRKKRSPKTYLTLGSGLLIVTALIWFVKIESPAQYYQSEMKTGGGTVTMEIRCDVILGMEGSEKYPADGVLMPLTEFSIAPEETALDLLYDAVKVYTLQTEVDGSGETAYVRGIESLYEFDFGDLSGWTYTVNGERPSVGCGGFPLHDGDRVVWAYTVSL